ncbi:unnamed protein product [Hydatigera taeniaeformis]|uniref:RNA-binding protein 48 n=1 Tax=Hydatigena taeniaeformis TaxID=6205 RepID=A0A0R3WHZ2_HYDTA|nr:unnamed protein product [Hydatigera taeniaeformis]
MLRELKSFPHHRKVGPCVTRPPYRDGKRKRAVKVFTIADESMYLLIFGAPSIGLLKPLKERIQQFEEIQQISKVSHPEAEEFTETYLVKFRSVNLARNVKRRLDDSSFYGAFLHIVYAPEYETVAECRVKMHSYRRLNDSEAVAWRTHSMKGRWDSSLNTEKTVVDLGVAEELSTSVSTATVATSEDAVLFGNPYAVPLHMVSASQIKRQMGDALDDARNYWASRGLDFFHNSKHHSLQPTDPSPIPLLTAQ